ncbi:MAG TPA: hypothetical protein DD379_09865 [Cyanobacteria bacterium UBA11162]|nr:hypothetical protein [Cyanobacteria bacterium UBA11370]HBL11699.1 hypothetical protein [Cyanobacteria bacterium UBA11162]HBY76103.1 hypothetical protein [Cyanobacteria bacterium UBA11148]
MEIAIALITFCVIASLVMPGLLPKELTFVLIVFGMAYLLIPDLQRALTTEKALALIVFGILFSLVIPDLAKK